MNSVEDVLISIRPAYADAIFSGQKTVELRRRIPALKVGAQLWIYVTKPIGAVRGTAVVKGIFDGSPDFVWSEYGNATGLTRSAFDHYFEGSEKATALVMANVRTIEPVSIEMLRAMRPQFHPPQVLTRLSTHEAETLRRHSARPVLG